MQTITLFTGQGQTYPDIPSAWNAIPDDVVGSGNSYEIVLDKGAVFDFGKTALKLSGKATGPSNRIKIRPAAGSDYRTATDAVSNAFGIDANKGVLLRFSVEYAPSLAINNDYVTLEGLQILHAGGGNDNKLVNIDNACANVLIDSCILESRVNGYYAYVLGLRNATARNCLLIANAASNQGVHFEFGNGRAENCTIVRPSNFGASAKAFDSANNRGNVVNCAVFGFSDAKWGVPVSNIVNNGTDLAELGGTGPRGLAYADQFVSTAGVFDFRTKTGSALINAGVEPPADNVHAPVGERRQGTAADIGAWEFAEAVKAPSGVVTSIVGATRIDDTARSVTISGTATNTPTRGSMRLVPTATSYNAAEATAYQNLTLNAAKTEFTTTFLGLKEGRYDIEYTLANAAFTSQGTNPLGTVNVVTMKAATLVQVLDGEVLTVEGTFTGSVVSGSILVPAASASPEGALSQNASLVIVGNNYSVSVPLPPGNYDAPVLRFNGPAGSTLPQTGTSAVSVVGLSGTPEVPGGDTPPEGPPQRRVSLVLRDGTRKPIPQLSGLRWAVHSGLTPDAYGTPLAKGTSGSSDDAGVFSVAFTTAALGSGDPVRFEVTESDGRLGQEPAPRTFVGIVQVN